MDDTLNSEDNPFLMVFRAMRAELFPTGHERFVSSVITFDHDTQSTTVTNDQLVTAYLSETGINFTSYNSSGFSVELRYEVFVNSGTKLWGEKLSNANWWIIAQAVRLRNTGLQVLLKGRNIVTNVELLDARSGVLPQNTSIKLNLPGWNSTCQIKVNLDLAWDSLPPETEQ